MIEAKAVVGENRTPSELLIMHIVLILVAC